MMIVGTALLALGRSVAILALARAFQGMSGAVVWTIAMAISLETVGPQNLGTVVGTVSRTLTNTLCILLQDAKYVMHSYSAFPQVQHSSHQSLAASSTRRPDTLEFLGWLLLSLALTSFSASLSLRKEWHRNTPRTANTNYLKMNHSSLRPPHPPLHHLPAARYLKLPFLSKALTSQHYQTRRTSSQGKQAGYNTDSRSLLAYTTQAYSPHYSSALFRQSSLAPLMRLFRLSPQSSTDSTL